MQTIKSKIEAINSFNNNTYQLLLERPAGLHYHAGQYLQIVLPDGAKHPFSIASAPCNEQQLELHIRATPESEDSLKIEKHFKQVDHLQLEIPLGDCFFSQPATTPLILIAAGTGFTQMKSIAEQSFHWGLQHDVHLYWGNLVSDDIYFQQQIKDWQQQQPGFHFHNVISNAQLCPNWQGRTGLVPHAVLEDFSDLGNTTIVVSGGPNMVYATLDLFKQHGMAEAAMRSDIFSYAPRD